MHILIISSACIIYGLLTSQQKLMPICYYRSSKYRTYMHKLQTHMPIGIFITFTPSEVYMIYDVQYTYRCIIKWDVN
jgi:hypothetical protein